MTDLAARLVAAQQSQAKLSEATDHLNLTLDQCEVAIRDLKLGVKAEVMFPEGNHYLVWKRWQGKEWCLVVFNSFDGEETKIRNVTRQQRMEAVNLLMPLVNAIIAGVSLEVERVEKAISQANELIDLVKGVSK